MSLLPFARLAYNFALIRHHGRLGIDFKQSLWNLVIAEMFMIRSLGEIL